MKRTVFWTFLTVHWLRLWPPQHRGGTGANLCQEIKIPTCHMVPPPSKNDNFKNPELYQYGITSKIINYFLKDRFLVEMSSEGLKWIPSHSPYPMFSFLFSLKALKVASYGALFLSARRKVKLRLSLRKQLSCNRTEKVLEVFF